MGLYVGEVGAGMDAYKSQAWRALYIGFKTTALERDAST